MLSSPTPYNVLCQRQMKGEDLSGEHPFTPRPRSPPTVLFPYAFIYSSTVPGFTFAAVLPVLFFMAVARLEFLHKKRTVFYSLLLRKKKKKGGSRVEVESQAFVSS